MAVEGGMKCVKFLVFIFNFIFWVSVGLGEVGGGAGAAGGGRGATGEGSGTGSPGRTGCSSPAPPGTSPPQSRGGQPLRLCVVPPPCFPLRLLPFPHTCLEHPPDPPAGIELGVMGTRGGSCCLGVLQRVQGGEGEKPGTRQCCGYTPLSVGSRVNKTGLWRGPEVRVRTPWVAVCPPLLRPTAGVTPWGRAQVWGSRGVKQEAQGAQRSVWVWGTGRARLPGHHPVPPTQGMTRP